MQLVELGVEAAADHAALPHDRRRLVEQRALEEVRGAPRDPAAAREPRGGSERAAVSRIASISGMRASVSRSDTSSRALARPHADPRDQALDVVQLRQRVAQALEPRGVVDEVGDAVLAVEDVGDLRERLEHPGLEEAAAGGASAFDP